MSGIFGQLGALLSGGSGGGQASIPQLLIQMIANQQGGLGGLVQQLQSAGLGNAVSSWVGTGANLPVNSQQLSGVFTNDVVEKMAEHTGLSHDQVLDEVSNHLPGLVDGMTPGGQVPDASGPDLLQMGLSLLRGR